MRSHEFTEIHFNSGHPHHFNPRDLRSMFTNFFHVLNWAKPRGISQGDESSPRAWTIDEFGNTIPLTNQQSHGYNVGYNFEHEAHNSGYVLIRDHAGVPIALHHENWLAILQDLCDVSRNQSRLMDYLVQQFMVVMDGGGEWTPRSLIINNVDAVKEVFVRLFNADTGRTKRQKEEAQSRASTVWRQYRDCLKEYEDALRRLESGEHATFTTESELVEARAESVLASLRDNPLICGLSVRSDRLRVVTKPLPSERSRGRTGYYDGLRRLLIHIPLTFKTVRVDDMHGLRIHSLGSNGVLSPLPNKEGFFWGDGEFCLGSTRYVVDKNILSGDWDLVVMSLLNGITGSRELRRYTEIYREEAAAEAEAAAAADAEHSALEEEAEDE